MSIEQLPKGTSRLLSSSQVLTSPVSLVKELLDNAIDAKATSIDITIAANTLDKIEVRDNGHGISQENLSVIGQRGYTSKLRNFNELKALSGLSLGFRGEALASVLELGDFSITTRVDGEIVATIAKLKPCGGISSQASTSHPVGTSICITNFFSRLPVRKQTALKDAKKNISRIKEMLQSYALARLNVRLTLKVLKAIKRSWYFSPRANESTREIFSHVIGREVAAQCLEMIRTLPSSLQVGIESIGLGDEHPEVSAYPQNSEIRPQSGFVVQAFLPKPDADLSKISGSQYISIDSRPVSCTRGTAKKIVSLYKTVLFATSVEVISEKIKSPFLRLNIICPAGSYDVNVEPAKDDILFEDESQLLSLLEGLFRNVYSDRVLTTSASNKASKPRYEAPVTDHCREYSEPMTINDEATFCANSKLEIPKEPDVTGECDNRSCHSSPEIPLRLSVMDGARSPPSPETPDAHLTTSQLRSSFDMSGDYLEELEFDKELTTVSCDQMTEDDTRSKQTPQDSNALNPWLIAKLNTPITKKKAPRSTLAGSAEGSVSDSSPLTPFMLPTLGRSSTPYPSPGNSNLGVLETRTHGSTCVSEYSQSSIMRWLQQKGEISCEIPTCSYSIPLPSTESSDRARAPETVESAFIDGDLSFSTLQSPSTTQAGFPRRVRPGINRPFVSPVKDAHSLASSAAEMRVKSLPSCRPQSSEEHLRISDGDVSGRVNGAMRSSEAHDALDFERRKEMATRKLRAQLRRSQSSTKTLLSQRIERPTSSLYNDRHHVDIVALDISQNHSEIMRTEDKVPHKTCLLEDDPRAYLMRRQQSIAACSDDPTAGRKLKRAKTTLLPLETIPGGTELHGLCQVSSTNLDDVHKALLALISYDQYAKSGEQAIGLLMSAADIQVVEMKLATVVRHWLRDSKSEETNVTIDLRDLRGRSFATG